MFMCVWDYGIMEMDGDGQREEMGGEKYTNFRV